jgi:hypothetical protein
MTLTIGLAIAKEFHGNVLKLNASRVEPQTVNWRNCANTDLVATGQVSDGH